MQRKLMDALDAAWALVERSDDPAVVARARDKARLCGQMAAAVRKVATLVPPPKDKPGLPPVVEPAKAPAAQAVAMRAALDRMGRR
ncbi:hypothetical protein [Caulobacter sp. RHG1]|uniref:hypothetical protein n=1 Tax=Caulobacter sp. (strain RHG1) TaxID=2545762 RepID=UPI001F512507|nr:hypothetical protein [Caulobacter sp. RHG1]